MIHYKKFLANLLAIALLITGIPITSYAEETGDTIDDGTGSGHTQIGKGGGDWGNDNGRSGLRFSLVDANDPTKVISKDDSGEPLVVDFIFCSEETFNNNCGPIDGSAPSPIYGRKVKGFTNIKTQPLSRTTNKYKQIFLPEKLAQIQASDPEGYELLDRNIFSSMQWMLETDKGIYEGMGAAINYWLMTNNTNDKITDIWSKYVSGNIPSSTIDSTGAEVEVPQVNKDPKAENTNKVNSGNKDKNNKTDKTNVTQTDDLHLYNNYVHNIGGLAAHHKGTKNKYEAYVNFMRQYGNYNDYLNLYYAQGRLSTAQWNDLCTRLRNQKVIMAKWCFGGSGYVPSYDEIFGYNDYSSLIDKLFGVMTSYADEPNGNKENETIAGDSLIDNNKTDISHLGAILDMKDEDGNYIFRTDSTLKSGKPIRMADEDWRLFIEPLDWFTPFDINGKYPLSPYRFYGTISNIIDAMDSPVYGVNAQLNNGTQHHLNRRTFNKISWQSMTLSEDLEKKSKMFNHKFMFQDASDFIQTYDMPTNRKLADWNKILTNPSGIPQQIGFAIQVYWVNNKEKLDNSSNISTWDSNNYPEVLPGPAPDASNDTEYPPETNFGELSKKFNIAKWYYIEFPEEGEEEVVDVTVRKDTPHVVGIVNEGTLDSDYFWEIEKWATGKDEILPQSGDKTRTYEEFCKSNPGDYIGFKPSILNLEPEDKDQVLYVKLVLKQLPKKPTVVKVYETDGNTDKVEIEKNVVIENNKYDVTTPDGEYKYVENVVADEEYTEEPSSWQDIPEGFISNKESTILVDSLTRVIYIRYERDKQPGAKNVIILHEDELAYPYSMEDLK